MVFYQVKCSSTSSSSSGRLDSRLHQTARKKLSHAMSEDSYVSKESKILSVDGFITLKRLLELYLKTLNLSIMVPQAPAETADSKTPAAPTFTAMDFAQFCRDMNRLPLDLLCDSYDPTIQADLAAATISTTVYLQFDPVLDEIIADDLLELAPQDIDFLARVEAPFRTQKILRRLGGQYYWGLDSLRVKLYNEMKDLQWEEQHSLLQFNSSFERHILSCQQMGFNLGMIDQGLLYLDKVTLNRKDNHIISSAALAIRLNQLTSLSELIQSFSLAVLRKDGAGIIPYDTTIQTMNFLSFQRQYPAASKGTKGSSKSGSNKRAGNTTKTKPAVDLDCYSCGTKVSSKEIVKHLKTKCKGARHKCGTCGENGHIEAVCQTYRQQRVARQTKKTGDTVNGTAETTPPPMNNQLLSYGDINSPGGPIFAMLLPDECHHR